MLADKLGAEAAAGARVLRCHRDGSEGAADLSKVRLICAGATSDCDTTPSKVWAASFFIRMVAMLGTPSLIQGLASALDPVLVEGSGRILVLTIEDATRLGRSYLLCA